VFKRYQQIHFVGIGGVGMSGIAEILLTLGYRVTGSDRRRNETVERLEQMGAKVFIGHAAGNVEGAHVVVYSSAISRDNVELVTAHNRQIPIIPRAEMLAELMRLKYGIAVAGTHGKTTTTSLVGAVLAEGRYDPTTVVGGRVTNLGSNARLGQGDYLVAEADESDGQLLKLAPTIAVVATSDAEHPAHYGSPEASSEAFLTSDNRVPFLGSAGGQRRFQIRGTAAGVTVVDDYGHHPAEIRATLAAAKAGFDSRVVTVFQPHRYTRTRDLKTEFLTAFNQADVLVVMDIYPAGES